MKKFVKMLIGISALSTIIGLGVLIVIIIADVFGRTPGGEIEVISFTFKSALYCVLFGYSYLPFDEPPIEK